MKSHITTIIIAFGLSLGTVSGQAYLDLLKDQNYTAIANALSEEVNLKINRDDKITGKSKVLPALKAKLKAFAPTRLETKHKGSSAESESDYLIAKLFNAKDEAIRVFVHLENSGNGRQICDIKLRSI